MVATEARRPKYGGSFANVREFIKIQNNSTPVENQEILDAADASRESFYKQHNSVLADIQRDFEKK